MGHKSLLCAESDCLLALFQYRLRAHVSGDPGTNSLHTIHIATCPVPILSPALIVDTTCALGPSTAAVTPSDAHAHLGGVLLSCDPRRGLGHGEYVFGHLLLAMVLEDIHGTLPLINTCARITVNNTSPSFACWLISRI